MHKARIADVVITLNVSADRTQVRILLEKNRGGEGGWLSDYLETAYAYGRVTSIEGTVRPREPDSAPELPFGEARA